MKKRVLAILILAVIILFMGGALAYKTFIIPSISLEKMKYCGEKEDCIPVKCGCGCTGCGGNGLDYDEVINKKYERVWYSQKKCTNTLEPNQDCSFVCCPIGEIDCKENKCTFTEN